MRAVPSPAPLVSPLLVGAALLAAAGGVYLLVRTRRPALPQGEVSAGALIYEVGAVQVVQQGLWLRWSSGLQVDADGDPRAYHPGDWGPRSPGRQPLGLDAPENAGRPLDPSAPGPGTWPGVVASGAPGAQVPLVQSGQAPAQPFAGYWLSKTALQDSRYPSDDVRSYISSSAIPYIAVPPELRKLGVRLGDLVRVMRSGRSSFAIVADVGPAGKLGEGSILLAERLGVPADPRGGGVRDGVRFELLLGSSSERPLSLTEIDSSAW